ncbi:MAG: glycosyltransferase [Desulfobacteraceae bacterium]|nr:glycosyltransferase [Desulfobacteraceae bacterium]
MRNDVPADLEKSQEIQGKIIHVTEGMELSLGGTTQFVTTLCKTLSASGFEPEIWVPGQNKAGEFSDNDILIRKFEISSPRFICRCKELYPALKGLYPKPALIHQHGLWLDPYRVAAGFARKHGILFMISLHGMLEPWALQRSSFKKKIAWSVFQGHDVRMASCLHAATRREAENIRKLGIKTPIAVIPNGIKIQDTKPGIEDIFTYYPFLADKRIILSLGRIHPVKGLDFFGKVWSGVADDFPDWHWVIAGPDEDNYQSVLTKLFNDLNISGRTTFVSSVHGAKKFALLNASEFLILPSYLESFGIVVLEALNEETPVMATTNCPWPELESCECGWWLKQDVGIWESALRKVMNMDSLMLNHFGINGKSLVRKKYTEGQLSRSMTDVYKWVLFGSRPPSCLY